MEARCCRGVCAGLSPRTPPWGQADLREPRLTRKPGTQGFQEQDGLMTAPAPPPRARQSPEGKWLESQGPAIAKLAPMGSGRVPGPGCTRGSGQLALYLGDHLAPLVECPHCDKSLSFVHFSVSTKHSK